MKDDDFWARLEPVEDLRGGGYRTRHVILKRRHASFSQSVYSCRLHDKIAPNRDYSSEGLCSFVKGKSWKFIDAIAVGLIVDGSTMRLKPASVKACPWECEYAYEAGEHVLRLSYYLLNSGHGGVGTVTAGVESASGDVSILFEPFFDIRPVVASPDVESPDVELSEDMLVVRSGEKTACVGSNGAVFRGPGCTKDWKYKLGTGRRARIDTHISPVPESKRITSYCEIEVPGNKAELKFSCAGTRKGALALLDHRTAGPQEDLMLAQAMRKAVFPDYKGSDLEKGIVWRTLGMARFGMDFEGTKCIEAGCLLSRELLLRDQFEGLLHNYLAIKRMAGTACIKNTLLKAFDLQDGWGRVPANCSRDTPGYNSADATLIAFILAGALVRDTNDGDFAKGAAEAFKKYLEGVSSCDLAPEGPPMVKPNGLISVSPALARVDGFRDVEGHKVPERVDAGWAQELIERGRVDELNLQMYLLPEVNARWIRCLEAGWLFTKYTRDFRMADRCKMIYYRALEAYKPLFFNAGTGFINNMLTADESGLGRRTDPAIGTPGMAAAAILGTDVFAARELERIALVTKKRLLREKWGLPFGTAMMEGAQCVYMDRGGEYGGAVFPGDTPYLLALLRSTGDRDIADRILAANLRHQMEEGFVFYNNELFSCDHEMVPSGDPVRWWSQWVDPYLDREKRP